MRVAIVGCEAAKVTPETEAKARALIRRMLSGASVVVSGGCHLGGVDIWAEEEADRLGIRKKVYKPKKRSWSSGYRERNLKIAKDCDVLHNIVVAEYPMSFRGMRFDLCYHCNTDEHVKSGGCWTAHRARELGKRVHMHVISLTISVRAYTP